MSHQENLVKFLRREIGGANLSNEQIKQFSKQLKELGILDMSKSNTAEWLIRDSVGQATIITLVTWFSLGLLSKIVDIKTITQGK